jgi:hypothetical protein
MTYELRLFNDPVSITRLGTKCRMTTHDELQNSTNILN